MADQSSSQEKTEDATPKRLRDARKKGQVAKSRDMNTVFILVVAFAALSAFGKYFTENFEVVMKKAFAISSETNIDNEKLFLFVHDFFFDYIKIVAPYLGVVAFAALFIGFVQIGPVFSPEPMKPQLKRLNMFANIKNMFKVTLVVELLKNVAKVFLVFFLAYLTVKADLAQIILTVTGSMLQTTSVLIQVITSFLIKVFVCFIVIALADLSFQRWNYKKEMRMTKEEVKKEYKQDEGDPLIKSQRRHLHQEIAMSDTKSAVSASDAVITNPTEVAVAIKYDESEMMAPQVQAKGQRLFAEAIRDFAKEANVPIVQNVPLAWSLLELEIGDDIPEELYAAVAEVLVIVYKMREENKGI